MTFFAANRPKALIFGSRYGVPCGMTLHGKVSDSGAPAVSANLSPREQPLRATKEILTDKSIKSLPTPAAENRSTVYDGIVPGLMVRVTDQGHKSFRLAARFPLNPKNPTRRLLGKVGVLTLAESRDKARAWHC
jgi:Arm DNA-binding domain